MTQLTDFKIARGSLRPIASGNEAQFFDLDGILKTKDSSGFVRSYQKNAATAAQVLSTTTRTYIAGSAVALAAAGALQIGSTFRWRISVVKTGAGTATAGIDVAFGTTGTTADTARISFTKPAGTAVVDTGTIWLEVTVRGPISGAGVCSAILQVTHSLATTGLIAQQIYTAILVPGGFDLTTPTFVGICITPGLSDNFTIDSVITEAWDV